MLGRDPLIPPERLRRYGRADFAADGEATLERLLDAAGLQPGHRVLDVGCGWGATARALSGFLARGGGGYEGFDVDREAIGWCRRAYARRHPHFRFLRADLFHPRFHPGGAHSAAEYRFPYEDASFDLVLATDVLPHLLQEEAINYVGEAARVLAPGGRLYATLFVLDGESRTAVESGKAAMPFLAAGEDVALVSEERPEEAVAYDLGPLLEGTGLGVDSLRPGSWRGDESAPALLDELVARRA